MQTMKSGENANNVAMSGMPDKKVSSVNFASPKNQKLSGQQQNRLIRKELCEFDVLTKINRIHSKHFELIINFEIIKVYRKRESANIYLRKLLNQKKCQN